MKIESGIKKNSDGTFDVRVATNIKDQFFHRWKRNVLTLGEARRIKNQFLEERAVWKDRLRNGTKLWTEALEEYFKIAQTQLRPSTYQNEVHSLNAHTEAWLSRHVDEFRKEEIQHHINKVLEGKSPATKNSLAKFIRKVFQLQCDNGVLPFNPANKIRFSKDGLKNNRLDCMTRNEIELLLGEAERRNHPWFPVWKVTYGCGLRSGEAYALKASDIDFENGVLTVSRNYCFKSEAVGPTKNREIRTIPINRELRQFLMELKMLRGNEEFLLPRVAGWKHGDAAKIIKAFQKELGMKQTNFHSLRASFITHLLLKNIPEATVRKMVGHNDFKTTQRYVRLSASDLKGATDCLEFDDSSNVGQVLPFQPRPS